MDTPNAILYNMGFAPPDANVRSKPANYFDTTTLVAGTLTYPLFNNPVLNPALRNKQFPQSDSEIFFITDITGYFNSLFNGTVTASNYSLFLFESYLEILVGDRQKIKIPALEFLNFVEGEVNAVTTVNFRKLVNCRNLRYPIIFNASEQITINFVTNATSAAAFAANTVRVEFCGFKYDKLDWFIKQFSAGNNFDIINYSLYDVQTCVPGAATVYTLFNNANKPLTEFSKILPAATGETFTAEAIELMWSSVAASNPSAMYADLDGIQLNINVNDVLFYTGNAQSQISLISSATVAADTYTFFKRRNFILPEPIVFGSNQKTLITLVQPVIATISAVPFIAILKGTLTRSKV
jgi:hypothetical protein